MKACMGRLGMLLFWLGACSCTDRRACTATAPTPPRSCYRAHASNVACCRCRISPPQVIAQDKWSICVRTSNRIVLPPSPHDRCTIGTRAVSRGLGNGARFIEERCGIGHW